MMVAAAVVVAGLVMAAGLAIAMALLALSNDAAGTPGSSPASTTRGVSAVTTAGASTSSSVDPAAGSLAGSSSSASANSSASTPAGASASASGTPAVQRDMSTATAESVPAAQQSNGVLAQAESEISTSVVESKRHLAARQAREEFTLSSADMRSIPADAEVSRFSLAATGLDSELSNEQVQLIRNAIATIEESGICGFVFLDADTGEGIAYNADADAYIASASKAVLAYYALQNGAAELDYERDNIEDAIRYSDNDAFEAFGYNYFDEDYIAWLAAHGTEWPLSTYDLYAPMSARSLAMVWAEILDYVDGGSEAASWFADVLTDTSVSFIRNAVDDEQARVMNKAGWIVDWDVNSVTDAGIVKDDGHTYLMAIVTDQPDSEETEEAATVLARSLYDLRDTLE